jgi:hypothetical protein
MKSIITPSTAPASPNVVGPGQGSGPPNMVPPEGGQHAGGTDLRAGADEPKPEIFRPRTITR